MLVSSLQCLPLLFATSLLGLVGSGTSRLEFNSRSFRFPAGLGAAALVGLGAISLEQFSASNRNLWHRGLAASSSVPYQNALDHHQYHLAVSVSVSAPAYLPIPEMSHHTETQPPPSPYVFHYSYSIWQNLVFYTTMTKPYVYVPTPRGVPNLRSHFSRSRITIPFIMARRWHRPHSAYPLPSILGDFDHISYYEHDHLPDKVNPVFLLVQDTRSPRIRSSCTPPPTRCL